VPTPVAEGCGSQLLVTVTGTLGSVLGSPVSLLPGQYNATYKVVDECGKMQTCSTSFEVRDTISPTIVCKDILTVDILPSCEALIWVDDLIESVSDNCSSLVSLSLIENSIALDSTYGPCDIGMQDVAVWAIDQVGNKSHCQTRLLITNTLGNCECDPILGGKIETDVGPDIENVNVHVTSTVGFPIDRQTDELGEYQLTIVPGADYNVTPSLDEFPSNGVTTFDFVLIRKHILGVDTLGTPYKIIAADINRSGSVTTFDLVELRKLILTIYAEFPDNTSWRFVDADYVFPNPLNPFVEDFPESVQLNELVQDKLDVNFIGIKIGDVNGSAITNFSSNSPKDD
jgi:hypothetical protein